MSPRFGESRRWILALSLILATQLCACGGGDGTDPGSTSEGTSEQQGTGTDGGSGKGAGSGGHPDAGSPDTDPQARLFALRNQAKLHADRDTDEGYVEAARLLEQVVAESPDTPRDRLNLARALVFTDRAMEAGPHLETARAQVGTNEAHPALSYVSGIHANRAADRELALSYFGEVTEALPEHLHAWYQRGYVAERLKQLELANECYAKVLEIDPKYRAAAYRRVIVLRQLGRADEEKAASEVFAALPQETQPDPEKCDLAMVDLIPSDRAAAEPAKSEVSFEKLQSAPSGMRSVAEWTVGGTPAALLATDEGVQVVGATVQCDWLGHAASHVLVGDLDNDESPDAVLVGAAAPGSSSGTGKPIAIEVGFGREEGVFLPLASMGTVQGELGRVYLLDIDHDGDLDLIGLRNGSGPGWIRNNGDRTFEAWAAITTVTPSEFAQTPGADGVSGETASPDRVRSVMTAATSLDFGDFDQGNDLDLIVSGPGETMALLNLRDGTFRPVFIETGPLADIAVGDLNNDGAPDLVGVRAERGGWIRYHNVDVKGKRADFRLRDAGQGSGPGDQTRLLLEDIDNDADLDLVTFSRKEIAAFSNEGGRTFSFSSMTREYVGEHLLGVTMTGHVATTDLDDDGRIELWVGGVGGEESFSIEASNERGYDAWRMRPKGARDNLEGIGTLVEQFAGDTYQMRMIRGARGVRFGLGGRSIQQLDGVRMSWPQGIIQSELQADFVLETAREFRPTQDEGLVASCPFLYAEGPDGWRFLTDVVGIAPLDEWLPPGGTAHQDPEEFVRIDGRDLVVRDGRVRLAITEELRETTYLDRVELWWADHPSDHVLYLDESTNQGAYDPLRVYAVPVADLQPARDVRTDDGADATELAESGDFRYVHGYGEAPSQWSGWVEPYSLELTAPEGAGTLLLTGRIHWYDSTVSYALNQNGRGWNSLRLEKLGEAGRSVRENGGIHPEVLVSDIGLPAGMDRTLVSTWDEPLVTDTRLRLHGQFRFLWDRILFAPPLQRLELSSADGMPVSGHVMLDGKTKTGSVRAVTVSKTLPTVATLEYHGYSQIVGDKARHEQTYDYDSAGPDDAFARAWGPATRYGDVRPLLERHDDELAVLVAGDRVVLEFPVPALENAENRAERTYFLKISGWAKEGSFHNRTGRWIEPLPFRGMSAYPPPADEAPANDSYENYLDSYQTRFITGGE